jgi:hypothetical protein
MTAPTIIGGDVSDDIANVARLSAQPCDDLAGEVVQRTLGTVVELALSATPLSLGGE